MFSTWSIIKTTIYPIIAVGATYLWLNNEVFWILAMLIVIDFITGIIKAYRIWDKVTSKWMWVWQASKAFLLLIPILVSLWFKAIWEDWTKVLTSLLWILIVAEIYSSVSNIMQIIKGKYIEEFDVITLILSWVLGKIKTVLENLLK